MKLLVLAITSIALFTADCRERPDQQEMANVANDIDDPGFLDEHVKSVNADISDDLTGFYGPGLKDVLSHKTDLIPETTPDAFEAYKFSSLYHLQKENESGKSLAISRGYSKCKSDIVCSLLGGSCVMESDLCNGREVSSLCSGAKCKCCIPVNMEVKLHEIETLLHSIVDNLTVADSELHTDIDTLANSLISNITILNENMVDFVNSSNQDLSSSISEMKNKLNHISEKLTISNANLASELESLKAGQDTVDGKLKKLQDVVDTINSKVSSMSKKECSAKDGMVVIGNQCFKRFALKKNWDDALKHCVDNGLNLAQPLNPLLLAIYMKQMGWAIPGENWDIRRHWIGGQGTGTCMAWLSGTCIPKASTLWYDNYNGGDIGPDGVATNFALDIDVLYEDHPLDADDKNFARYFICEKEF